MSRTVFGVGLEFEGELTGSDPVVIRGRLRGQVSVSGSFRVDRDAEVEARVEADVVEVSGRIRGDVHARSRVDLASEGELLGDIHAPRVLIADGARFRGNVDMG